MVGKFQTILEILFSLVYDSKHFGRARIQNSKGDIYETFNESLDFSVEEVEQVLDLAKDIEMNPKKYAHACDGKKIATLFYEPSTRTRLSFEAAMLNLGVCTWFF